MFTYWILSTYASLYNVSTTSVQILNKFIFGIHLKKNLPVLFFNRSKELKKNLPVLFINRSKELGDRSNAKRTEITAEIILRILLTLIALIYIVHTEDTRSVCCNSRF